MTNRIDTLAELEALYGEANPISLAKETPSLTLEYHRLIEASPFVSVATIGEGGMDCSPRGDTAPVVHILDDRTLALPDRRGNNRLDTMKNIVSDPRIALLFLIPGCNETLRVNGKAYLSTDTELIVRFTKQDKAPVTVMVIEIGSVYFQCARALVRSQLWSPNVHVERAELPTAGQMTKAALPDFDAKEYDGGLSARQAKSLY